MKSPVAVACTVALFSMPLYLNAASNLEHTAKAYMDSLISHDRSAMKATVRSSSQAESSWDNRSESVSRIQADKRSHPVGYRNRGCDERTEKVVCDFVITSAQGESWSLVLHVAKGSGKVEDALRGR